MVPLSTWNVTLKEQKTFVWRSVLMLYSFHVLYKQKTEYQKGFFYGINNSVLTCHVIDIYLRNFHILNMFFIFVFKRKLGKTKQRNKRGKKPDKYPENLWKDYLLTLSPDLILWIAFSCRCISMFLFELNYLFSSCRGWRGRSHQHDSTHLADRTGRDSLLQVAMNRIGR